jgi:hypothetical protein
LLIIIIIIIIITTIVVPTKIVLIKNEERVNRDLTRNEVKVNIEGVKVNREGVKVNREGADIIIMMIEDKSNLIIIILFSKIL